MLIVAILIALLVDALALFGLWKLLERVESTPVRVLAMVGTAAIVLGTAAVASLATTTVRTMIVMAAMERREPTRTILETDRETGAKLRAAVVRGLEKRGGDLAGNVRDEVAGVLRPYMAYRLANAPDASVIASARETRGILSAASAQGPQTCADVLRGDVDTLRRLASDGAGAWIPEMLRADALDQPGRASPAEVAAFAAGVAARAGITPDDLRRAASGRDGPAACTFPIAAIDAATALPQDRAAAMLRGLGYGGLAATK